MLTENQVIQLRESLNNKGYCQVNNILHPQLKEYLQISAQMLAQGPLEKEIWELIQNKNQPSQYLYSSIIGETLLTYFTPIYSQISGKNLNPTYSFFRKYYKTNKLLKHTDRSSCQYSATIQVDSSEDTSWPIWIKDKMNIDIKCDTKIGDIVFYKGEEVPHWREELEYEHSSHFFLHWVDKDNPKYKPYWFDGRERLGISR
jgi:hypothetical protein